MILVTTAGKVGAEAALRLAEQGVPVRVLARRAGKVAGLARSGVDIALGDLDAPETVDDALRDVTGVILVSPASPAHELAVIDSALRAGVSHVVKVTSKASTDSPIARQRGQAEIEAALLASGLDHTLLRGNFYMQNFLMLAPAIARTATFGSCAGSGLVGFVDARDVGAVAAAVAMSPDRHAGATYMLTGPALLSYADVAGVLSTVVGRPVAFQERSRQQDSDAMVAAGVPETIAAMNAHAVSLIADGDAAWLSTDVRTLLGRAPRSFADFATDHATAFAGAGSPVEPVCNPTGRPGHPGNVRP